jgi:cytochrome bd-type quinol oxidase subunit 2
LINSLGYKGEKEGFYEKRDYVISLVLNLLILGMEGFAISNTLIGYVGNAKEAADDFFTHFTNLSNILLALAALVMIVADLVALKKGKLAKGTVLLKYVATISVFVTFLVAWAFLLPTQKPFDMRFVIDPAGFLWFHTVCPILAVLSFLVFEREPKLKWAWSFLGMSSVYVYAAVILPLVLTKKIDAPTSSLISAIRARM